MKVPFFIGKKRCKDNKNNQHQSIEAHMTMKLKLWSHLWVKVNVQIKTQSNVNFLVATPLWRSVGVKPNTPKVGDLESSGTPECLEFDSKAQNTSSEINT